MEQVMEHYGKAILIVVALLALGVVVVTLLAANDSGFIMGQFKSALEGFFSNMDSLVPMP